MGLRIAFDLDGVLADMDAELVRQAAILYGEPATEADRPPDEAASEDDGVPAIRAVRLSARQQRRLWKHVGTIENFWEGLQELEPGIIRRLAAMADERRWEIIFLTKRPQTAGYTAQVQTQRWLASKGFPFPSVFVVQGSRGRIAAALDLDFVVDDRPENCLDVAVDSRARAILVCRDQEKHLPESARRMGIGVVKSVEACLDILWQADAAAHDRPGMIGRVMRLLGLKEHERV